MEQRIATEPHTAFKVLRVIWERQTPWEKYHQQYDPEASGQGRGFSPQDTKPANELHDRLEDANWKWQELSSVDVIRCMRLLRKYGRQYLDAERERREAEQAASRAFTASALAQEDARRRKRNLERWGPDALVD